MLAELRRDLAGAPAVLAEMLAPMTADPAAAVEQVCGGPADDAVLAEPGVRAGLVDMLSEAFRQGAVGLAADLASYTLHDWGFDPRAVGAPVRCWYGAQDSIVSPAHGAWWAEQVADGSVTAVDGVGHLVIHRVWADVLAHLTAQR